MTAAIYVRISDDREGRSLGVARQEQDCRTLAERLSWPVGEVYVDNDVSAFSGKPRPAYRRLLTDIRNGTVTAVLAYAPDRLYRRLADLAEFIDTVRAAGCAVQTVAAGEIDLSSAAGRTTAGLLGVVAAGESDRQGERIRRKLQENAAAGRPHGGHRPYGWEVDRMTVRESEAAVIREAASRLLAGEPLRSVFRDLNTRGLHSSTGKPWTHPTFRKVMLQARHAGIITHHGQELGTASWPPILAPETWRALVRVLSDPSRVTTPGQGGTVHLLSGIARCGVCGGPLRVGRSKGTMAYRCQLSACTSRRMDYLEQYVTEVVIARLSRADAAGLLTPADDTDARQRAAQQAERVRHRLDEAAASYASGLLTMRQLETINATLRPELATLEAACAPPPDRALMLGALVSADDVRSAWQALSGDARRTVVRLLLDITVHRARRGNTFSTDGIDLRWR